MRHGDFNTSKQVTSVKSMDDASTIPDFSPGESHPTSCIAFCKFDVIPVNCVVLIAPV